MNPGYLTWATPEHFEKRYVLYKRMIPEGCVFAVGPTETIKKVSVITGGYEVVIMQEVGNDE